MREWATPSTTGSFHFWINENGRLNDTASDKSWANLDRAIIPIRSGADFKESY